MCTQSSSFREIAAALASACRIGSILDVADLREKCLAVTEDGKTPLTAPTIELTTKNGMKLPFSALGTFLTSGHLDLCVELRDNWKVSRDDVLRTALVFAEAISAFFLFTKWFFITTQSVWDINANTFPRLSKLILANTCFHNNPASALLMRTHWQASVDVICHDDCLVFRYAAKMGRFNFFFALSSSEDVHARLKECAKLRTYLGQISETIHKIILFVEPDKPADPTPSVKIEPESEPDVVSPPQESIRADWGSSSLDTAFAPCSGALSEREAPVDISDELCSSSQLALPSTKELIGDSKRGQAQQKRVLSSLGLKIRQNASDSLRVLVATPSVSRASAAKK